MKIFAKPTLLFSSLFIVAGAFGWAGTFSRWRLVTQAQRQQDQCVAHLHQIREALFRYRADHKGELPKEGLTALIPKYLPDNSVLICPAVRARTDLASAFLGKSPIQCTFMHMYLSRDFPASIQTRAGKTPLLVCTFHTWEAANGIRLLLLRQDGEVEVVDPSKGPCIFSY